MEDLRMCSRGHTIEPLAQFCKFGHETCFRLKCPSIKCPFRTNPAIQEFQDLLQSEVDEDFSNCHHADAMKVCKDKAKVNHVDEDLSKPKQLSNCLEDIKEEDKDKEKLKVNEESSKSNKQLEKRTCPICYRVFYSMGNMRAHVKSHHERKGRFNCQICDKTFCSKIALQYHEKRVHSNGGEILCENCDETFSNFEDYSSHRRKSHRSVHFQLEHTCEECGKNIRGKQNLNQHLKEVHALETTYNLNRVTLKTYPHNCDQCDSVFKRRSHLKSHIEGMHGGKRYPCNLCGKEFQNRSNLNRHAKNFHK
jgi:hypothetical protein